MLGSCVVNKKEKYFTRAEAEELYWINFGLKMIFIRHFIVGVPDKNS